MSPQPHFCPGCGQSLLGQLVWSDENAVRWCSRSCCEEFFNRRPGPKSYRFWVKFYCNGNLNHENGYQSEMAKDSVVAGWQEWSRVTDHNHHVEVTINDGS